MSVEKIKYYFLYSAQTFFYLYLSLYLVLLFTPMFLSSYFNPHQIIGPTSTEQYNPQNNTTRYLLITLGTTFLFFTFTILKEFKRTNIINIILILTIVFSFILGLSTGYQNKIGQIDMFHDGEQLGVGSALYEFNKAPYSEMFFLHGLFADPLIANLSFKTFGYSISSFYFVTIIMTIIGFLIALSCLILTIKNLPLFILLSLVLLNFPIGLTRDLFTFLLIIVYFLIQQEKLSLSFGIFFASLLSFSSFFWSIDRAYYLFATNIFFTSLIMISQLFSSQKFKIKSKNITLFILAFFIGTLIPLILGYIFLGQNSFFQFFQITFHVIPQIKPFLDEYNFPPFSIANIYPYWLPIILIIASLILSTHFLISTKFIRLSIFTLTITILSLLYFRSAVGRSDIDHIRYTLPIIIITFSITLYLQTEYLQNKIAQYFLITIISFILLTSYFNNALTFLPPTYQSNNLLETSTLFLSPDTRWLSSENQLVTEFIQKNSTQKDYLFVFTNESAYYYLTHRKNPTRFYTVWFASPNFYQQEVITDLQKNPPKFIIYKSDYWSNRIDNIQNSERLKQINEWILNNYQLNTKIESAEIYSKKSELIL